MTRPYRFRQAPSTATAAPPPPSRRPSREMMVALVGAVMIGLLFQGWRLLRKYRHHHRSHRPPGFDAQEESRRK